MCTHVFIIGRAFGSLGSSLSSRCLFSENLLSYTNTFPTSLPSYSSCCLLMCTYVFIVGRAFGSLGSSSSSRCLFSENFIELYKHLSNIITQLLLLLLIDVFTLYFLRIQDMCVHEPLCSSGVATPGPTRAQARAKLVCALVAKAQVPVINIGLGRRRIHVGI